MSDDAALKKRLRALMNLPENQSCCDCGDSKPTWASLIVPPPGTPASEWDGAIGAFCCFHCSGSHRRLGVHICFVRSVTLDTWKEKEVVSMEKGGNTKINKLFESKLNGAAKPDPKSDMTTRNEFIQDKYQQRKFYLFDSRALKITISQSAPSAKDGSGSRPPLLSKQSSLPCVPGLLSNMMTQEKSIFNPMFSASFGSKMDAFIEKEKADDVSIDVALEQEDPFQSASAQRDTRDAIFNSSFNLSFASGNLFTDTTTQSYRGTETYRQNNDSESIVQPSTQRLRERAAEQSARGRSLSNGRVRSRDKQRSHSRDDGQNNNSRRQSRRPSGEHGRKSHPSRSQSRSRRPRGDRDATSSRRGSMNGSENSSGKTRMSRSGSEHSLDTASITHRGSRSKSGSSVSTMSVVSSASSQRSNPRRPLSRTTNLRQRQSENSLRALSEHVSPKDREGIPQTSSQENMQVQSEHTPPVTRMRRARSDDQRLSMRGLAEAQKMLMTPLVPSDGKTGRRVPMKPAYDDLEMPLKCDIRDRDRGREHGRDRRGTSNERDERRHRSSSSRRPQRRRSGSNDRENTPSSSNSDEKRKGRRTEDRHRVRKSLSPTRQNSTRHRRPGGHSPRRPESQSRTRSPLPPSLSKNRSSNPSNSSRGNGHRSNRTNSKSPHRKRLHRENSARRKEQFSGMPALFASSDGKNGNETEETVECNSSYESATGEAQRRLSGSNY